MELLYPQSGFHNFFGGHDEFSPFLFDEPRCSHNRFDPSRGLVPGHSPSSTKRQRDTRPQSRMNYANGQRLHAASTVDVIIKLQQQTYSTGPINYPCRISVYKSTGWSTSPAEVLSIDATLTRPETTVRFEHLPLATPLFLNIRGSVTVVTKGQDELCAGLEQYLGSRCEIFVAPAAVPPTSTNTPNFGDGPKRMRRMSSLEQDQSPSRPSAGADQRKAEQPAGNVGGTSNGMDPSPMTRKISVASSERMKKLSSLENNFKVLRSEFDGLLNEIQQNPYTSQKSVMKKSFQMIKINLNRLQEIHIDSVQTVDLTTGKAEAKAMRRNLTRQVQGTVDEIDNVLKQYFQ